MKTLFQLPIVLFLSASTLAWAAPGGAAKSKSCFSENVKFAEITKGITPGLVLNGDVILNLLNSAVKGDTDACQIESQRAGDDMSLNTCGYSEEVAIHIITIKGKNRTWKLVVEENKISCGPKEFILKRISSNTGGIVATVSAGDKLIAQIQGCGEETADDYKLFGLQYRANGEIKNDGVLVNMNDDLVCATPTTDEHIVTFSKSKLGLE